jgi:hypothetical protein
MRELNWWPQPKNNTGIGLHLSANGWDSRYYGPNVSRDYDAWRAMGVQWLKVLTGSDSQLPPVTEFVKAGFEVIVRFYEERPHPGRVPAVDLMKRFADVGVHYVEGGNEPELTGEWADNRIPDNAIRLLALQYKRFSDNAYRAGVIPVTYAIEGDRAYSWFRPLLVELIDRGWQDCIEGSVIGVHNRPGRMPIDSPMIDATSGGVGFVWNSYEAFDNIVNDLLGYSLPILGTEAGREPPEVDGDLQKHAADNVAIMQMPWRPALFCQCFWLWPPGGMGNSTAWVDNATYGAVLPVVQAFRAMPKVIRNAVEPPAEDLDDAEIRQLAWQKLGVPLNTAAAFYVYAQAHSLGKPETAEWDAGAYRMQGYSGGVVFCKVGEWDKVRHIPWV